MSIPESVIEAASIRRVEKHGFDEARARRVILALAEDMPESAVEKALAAFDGAERAYWPAAMRTAIIAALKDIAGDSP